MAVGGWHGCPASGKDANDLFLFPHGATKGFYYFAPGACFGINIK
jgi:hypothetical protein